jgi:crotonobetaine/carnitine-CoA ligase
MKQPPGPFETAHLVSRMIVAPPPNDPGAFESRFRVRLMSHGYGMTEVLPVPQHLDRQDWSKPRNFIGRPHESIEVRVADDQGRPVPSDGETIGEMLVRPRHPGWMMTEYYNDPQATVDAWRHLWFHTGDLATVDGDGNLYLRGRKTDSIRRRGENVSAFELERVVVAHPAVREAAAYGVPSDLGEEDIKLDVVWQDSGGGMSPEKLLKHLRDELPPFMVPRYVQVRADLPKSSSQRIQKYLLRAEGVGPDAFDSERFRTP